MAASTMIKKTFADTMKESTVPDQWLLKPFYDTRQQMKTIVP